LTLRAPAAYIARNSELNERRPPMAARRFTRRTFLKTAVAATGPFVFTPARAQGFSWKRFQGKELFLLLTKHPFIDVLEKHIAEFESLSGMKVKWETLPEIQARQKLTVEMTANSGGIDAFFTSLHVEKKRFWKAGWYHPLNKFLQDASLTSPEFDWNDFTDGARAGVTPTVASRRWRPSSTPTCSSTGRTCSPRRS